VRQVDDPATLRNFKLFFEAFLGFYKLERPSG
jgi:CRISPR-associated protein Csm2